MKNRMIQYYGIRIDNNNTVYIKEYPGCFRDEAMQECMCVGTDLDALYTVADALNHNMSGNATYLEEFDYSPENFYKKQTDDAMDGETVRHPAYGTIGFARRTGSRGEALFGSSIEHRDTIAVTLRTGIVTRGLNTDWFTGENEIIEVEMSYSQFADAITSLNMGSGIPCTIRQMKGVGRLPDPEFQNKRDQYTQELKTQLNASSAEAKELYKNISEILTTKQSITKKDREEILKSLSRIVNGFDSHTEFSFKQYQEQLTRTIHEAKCEVEAFTQNKLLQIAQCAIVEHREELERLKAPIDVAKLEENN